jgi:hypothetical protein
MAWANAMRAFDRLIVGGDLDTLIVRVSASGPALVMHEGIAEACG